MSRDSEEYWNKYMLWNQTWVCLIPTWYLLAAKSWSLDSLAKTLKTGSLPVVAVNSLHEINVQSMSGS